MKVRDSDVLAGVRGQREISQALGAFGLWISPGYCPCSLGARFETYEPFISLIFQFFSGCGKPRIIETADTQSVDTGARLYLALI
jgi:hypothetical protein